MNCEILAVFPRTPNSLIHQQRPITNYIHSENIPKMIVVICKINWFLIIVADLGAISFAPRAKIQFVFYYPEKLCR